MDRKQTTVVVPCYNEAQRLQTQPFLEFSASHEHCALLFVNDGSTDDTLKKLRFLEAQSARIGVLDLETNRGKAEAVRQGLLAALYGKPKYVAYWDADLATPLNEVLRFERYLEEMQQLQMVMGCRIGLQGHHVQRRWPRRIAGRCFAFAASTILRTRLNDTQCGAKMFRANQGMYQIVNRPFKSRWVFDVEIILRIQSQYSGKSNHRILELPVRHWHDVAGSKIRISDWFMAGFDLLNIGLERQKSRPFDDSPMNGQGSSRKNSYQDAA